MKLEKRSIWLFSAALASTQLFAADFLDDFNTDITNPKYSTRVDSVSETPVLFTRTDSGLGVELIDDLPSDDERTQFLFQPTSYNDLIGISFILKSTEFSDSENGSVRMRIELPLYNDLEENGLGDESIDSRTGDVRAEITMSVFQDNSLSNFLLCLERREADGTKTPAIEGLDNCQVMETKPELNVPYSVNLSLDREGNRMQFSVNDEALAYDTPIDLFLPSSTDTEAVLQVRDGAASGEFHVSEFRTSSFRDNTFESVGAANPYRTDDFDNFDDDPSRSRVVDNSVMTLTAINSDATSGNDAFLRFDGANDYVAADMTYSSESDIQVGAGISVVRLAGRLYNDTSEGGSSDNVGTVWGSTQLVVNSDGVLVGEYCLIRSNTSDFSETVDLADGMDDGLCPRFDLPVIADQSYAASMKLDRTNKKVIFKLNEEIKEVQIGSEIFDRDGFYKRAQVRLTGGATGTVVGLFDNFTNSEELATSSLNGGGGAESSQSAGSGGGCSISRSGTDHGLLVLVLGSFIYLGSRICRRRSA